jgi:hypothetical protein
MKKKYLVTKVKPDAKMAVEVDGKKMNFSKSGYSFFLSDSGVAKAMDQSIGSAGTRDVVISEMPMANKDGIHNYTFTVKKPNLKQDTESKYEWVEVKPGEYKLRKKDELHTG